MVWGRAGEPRPAIGVWRMALALVVAAFLGGALGLVWQSAGFGTDEDEEDSAPADDPPSADESEGDA